ncbi:hypothetical protein PEXP_001490 [Penicillium expansum]|nr:hypothetical protein PEXP_001490 [Penicillium expansum]
MADLAGTAVGIISLGLQLCQGIVSYSEVWRGYDEEIQNTNNKAKALRMLLKTLRDTIEDLQETRPEVAADLEEKAMSMHSSIEKLRKIVERFKPARPEAFPEKVRAQLKKSVYYFQKDSLQDMQNHLDQIQNVLQTSLLIYNWQDTMESRAIQISMYEEMRSMHSTLKDAISSTGMPPPSVIQLACDSQLKQLPIMLSNSEPMVQANLGVVRKKDLPLISNMIELRGPLQLYTRRSILLDASCYANLKRNLRLILSQDEELIQAPMIMKAIIKESEKELREALASGHASSNDRIGAFSPLELAFGWPKGIKILLQSGESPHFHFPSLAVAEGVDNHASAALLLEAGCVIQMEDLVKSEQSLATHGIDVPIELDFATDSQESTVIYQTWLARKSKNFTKIMDSMYEIGFHDVDSPDEFGITPLMAFSPFMAEETPLIIKCAAWLMSKGASIERKMPTSNAKVAQFLTSRFINFHYMKSRSDLAGPDFENWKNGVAELGDACFFVSPIQDCCVCGCSPGGCTTLSVALRLIVWAASEYRSEIQHHHFRKTILSLIVWQDSWPNISQAIVRTLTFDALGLTHTCCTEINRPGFSWVPFQVPGRRDETEIDRILDDQHFLLKEFGELMEETESKLDELGLPLEEFLDGYWYDRIIEYLSRHGHYDEEHVTEARRMGIFLKAEEFCIPDRVSLRFRPRVQEVQGDSLSNDPK